MDQRFGVLWLVGLAAISPSAAATAHKGVFDEDPFFSGKPTSKQKGFFGDDPFFSGMGGFGKSLGDDSFGRLLPRKGSNSTSSSVSSETVYSRSGGHPGRFLARTKRCKDGECVVEERRRGDEPSGKATLSETHTKAADGNTQAHLTTDADFDAQAARIKNHMEKMNRQMKTHMQGMDSFFKDASSLGGTRGLFAKLPRSRPANEVPVALRPYYTHTRSGAAPLPQELDKLQAVLDSRSKDVSQDKSGLLNSGKLSKKRLLNNHHQRMDSSSDSIETSIVNGHVVKKRKTCHNGKCNESVVEGDAKKSSGDTALSEKRTETTGDTTDAALDAEGLRIRKHMKDMNRQMNRQMKNHMQAMDSFFKKI